MTMSATPGEDNTSADADDFDTALQPEGNALCHGCLDTGRCRLGVSGADRSGDDVLVRVTCASELRGSPGVAHGGWIASVFDEAMSQAVHQRVGKVVTATLSVHYRAPVPIEVLLEVAATIDDQQGRRLHTSAQMRVAGSTETLASATGVFVVRRDDHFARHRSQFPPI